MKYKGVKVERGEGQIFTDDLMIMIDDYKTGFFVKKFRMYVVSSTLEGSRKDILFYCVTAWVIRVFVEPKRMLVTFNF